MGEDVKYGVFSWGPCVVQLKISEEFRKKLLAEGEESKKEELKFTTKLAGVIKEEYAYRKKELFLPEISQVLGVYDQAFQKFKNKPYEQKPEYLLNALWVNYMKKNEFNPPHDHADNLSFVIFLDVPPEITKEQEDYKGQSSGPGSLMFLYGEGNRQAITYQGVVPKNGDMFIFPSWVKHYVSPFSSDVTRISVSGNVANSLDLNKIKHYTQNNMVDGKK